MPHLTTGLTVAAIAMKSKYIYFFYYAGGVCIIWLCMA